MPTVLITNAELSSSLSIIRSLGRQGWSVVAGSSRPDAPGHHSRYATVRLLHNDFGLAPDKALEDLVGAAHRYAVDVLIPVTDDALLTATPSRNRFPPTCALAAAPDGPLRLAMDKVATTRLAERLGIPTPDCQVVTSPEEARGFGDHLGWPVVVKPSFSRVRDGGGALHALTTRYAHNREELMAGISEVTALCPVLLQRYHRGQGVGVSLLTAEGRPLAAFQHRRLREVPPSGGVSSLRVSVGLDPQLYEWARRLLSALNWTGLAMVEFKVNGTEAVVMEVNGRVWGSMPLALRSGMDFASKLTDLYRPGPPHRSDVDTEYTLGVHSRDLGLELEWIEAVLRGRHQSPDGPPLPRRAALRAALQLARPGYGYDMFALDDPAPALTDLRRIAGHWLLRLHRRTEEMLAARGSGRAVGGA